MFAIAIAGLLLAVTSEVWSHSRQREKEKELLYVGDQFREAIALYYQRTPGTVKRYPEKLEDLLEDKRYLSMQRYLRKVHTDPMTGKSQWGTLAAPGGGIMGVYSLSDQRPVKSANFDTGDQSFAGSQRYSDWKFLYEPPTSSAGNQGKGR
jgi:type II secretory pathway pseudopilin PulG